MNYYLSIDIGASSGRHIVSWMENGKIKTKEVYRFENGMISKNGHLCWDIYKLYHEILEGMVKCRKCGYKPVSMGIDTWAVDYVLLDENDSILGETYAYRDGRTNGMDKKVYNIISEKQLYERTGIQKQIFNTIYQLEAVKNDDSQLMDKAECLLLLPDFFDFLLTGQKGTEYTNATTTQLVSPVTGDWDYELIEALGFNRDIFTPIYMPGTVIGGLKESIVNFVGFDTKVIRVASHDTASAVLAVPSYDKDTVYISSGTWSLMGVELLQAVITEDGMKANMTNEGGYDHRFRFLRNIMGLWMIQSLKKECADDMSYSALCAMAERYKRFDTIVDVNDEIFFAPASMKGAIDEYCDRNGLTKPASLGEYASLIYRSLAVAYGNALEEIEKITGRHYDRINVVGGGSKADYLNKLTAEVTGREVLAGPEETTAIGNAVAQLLADGTFSNIRDARKCIRESFEIRIFQS